MMLLRSPGPAAAAGSRLSPARRQHTARSSRATGAVRCVAMQLHHQQQRTCAAAGRTSLPRTSLPAAASSGRRSSRVARCALPPLAMVNVDFASPSLVLGVTLIGCGIALLQVRNMQREVSRDADIVVAAMISIVGSTLIFQGWRLDPLLLLCQALTTSVAFWYGLEAFKLRAAVGQDEDQQGPDPPGQLPPPYDAQARGPEGDFYQQATRSYLPPAGDRPLPPWAAQQQQQQQPTGLNGGSSRWGLPPPEQQAVRFGAYAQQGGSMPDAMYAGEQQQQQLYSAGSYGGAAAPPYDDAAGAAAGGGSVGPYGAAPQQQFGQQQQPQYDWGPAADGSGGYVQQQQQQPWLGVDAFGQSLQQQQLPYSAGGPEDPYAAAGAVLPDGTLAPAAPAGYGQQLPPSTQQQQQQRQQRGAAGSPGGYEQVDDWE